MHDSPPGRGQRVVYTSISGLVGSDLAEPEPAIRFRTNEVLWTPVPETTIHEDGNSRSNQDDVWSPHEVGDDHAEPDTASMQLTAERHLGCRVTSANASHERADACIRRARRARAQSCLRSVSLTGRRG